MTPKQQIELPAWLREGLNGDPTDPMPNKRSDERYVFSMLAYVREEKDTGFGESYPAKIFNVSTTGLGLVSRHPIKQGLLLCVSPQDGKPPDFVASDTVRARVVYCKQTIQGFKVGCEFVAS